MKLSGKMYILDNDPYFDKWFKKNGDDFELKYLKETLSFVKNFRVAVDGGAHYGSWSRFMATKFQTVYSIEGSEEIYECLVKNTFSYKNIKPMNKALGNERRRVKVGPGEGYDNTGCGMIIGEGDVDMIRIDDMKLENVDFIKLDIEGMEYDTLVGATETIKKYKPVIVFENKGHTSRFGQTNDSCSKYLERLGMVKLHNFPPGRDRDLVYGWNK